MSAEVSHTVEFINERMLEIQPGQTLLEASLDAGLPHYHVCGGNARCSTCRVLVESGSEFLTPPTPAELALSAKMGFPPKVRLACQTRVTGGPVRLHRLIIDDTDYDMITAGAPAQAKHSLGEERLLGLFFLDIRDFTPFAETHLPYDVIHILNRFFMVVRRALQAHRGRVIEVAGDGLYAVFGLEEEPAPAAEHGVAAGLQILTEIAALNRNYLEPYFRHHIAVGMGFHFGRVICGHVGIGLDGALSVIGYPVNVAARIQAATKQLNNSFLVSAAAFDLLPQPPENVASAEINLKGVSNTCKVYLLGQPYESASPGASSSDEARGPIHKLPAR